MTAYYIPTNLYSSKNRQHERVISTIVYRPGQHPEYCPINSELIALEIKMINDDIFWMAAYRVWFGRNKLCVVPVNSWKSEEWVQIDSSDDEVLSLDY